MSHSEKAPRREQQGLNWQAQALCQNGDLYFWAVLFGQDGNSSGPSSYRYSVHPGLMYMFKASCFACLSEPAGPSQIREHLSPSGRASSEVEMLSSHPQGQWFDHFV